MVCGSDHGLRQHGAFCDRRKPVVPALHVGAVAVLVRRGSRLVARLRARRAGDRTGLLDEVHALRARAAVPLRALRGQRRSPRVVWHRHRPDGAHAGLHHRRIRCRVALRGGGVADVPRGAGHHVVHRRAQRLARGRQALLDSVPRHRRQRTRMAVVCACAGRHRARLLAVSRVADTMPGSCTCTAST